MLVSMDLQDGVSLQSLAWLITMLEGHYGVLLPGASKSVEDGEREQGCNSSCSYANQKMHLTLTRQVAKVVASKNYA